MDHSNYGYGYNRVWCNTVMLEHGISWHRRCGFIATQIYSTRQIKLHCSTWTTMNKCTVYILWRSSYVTYVTYCIMVTCNYWKNHYRDFIMTTMASQITSFTIVYSIVYSGADQIKHQSFASLAFVMGIHRWPVNSPHKGPVTRKMLPLDDVIMCSKNRPQSIKHLSQ